MYRQRNAERLVILASIIPIVPSLLNLVLTAVLLITHAISVPPVNLNRLQAVMIMSSGAVIAIAIIMVVWLM